jgi:hypothetical protein
MTGIGGNQSTRRKTKAFENRLEIEGASPEVRLIVAILARAGIDTLNGDQSAAVFVRSNEFDRWCEMVGVNADKLRERLLTGGK